MEKKRTKKEIPAATQRKGEKVIQDEIICIINYHVSITSDIQIAGSRFCSRKFIHTMIIITSSMFNIHKNITYSVLCVRWISFTVKRKNYFFLNYALQSRIEAVPHVKEAGKREKRPTEWKQKLRAEVKDEKCWSSREDFSAVLTSAQENIYVHVAACYLSPPTFHCALESVAWEHCGPWHGGFYTHRLHCTY